MRKRAEIVERSFARSLERGRMRRTWPRAPENVHKRYLIHVAGHNLGMFVQQDLLITRCRSWAASAA